MWTSFLPSFSLYMTRNPMNLIEGIIPFSDFINANINSSSESSLVYFATIWKKCKNEVFFFTPELWSINTPPTVAHNSRSGYRVSYSMRLKYYRDIHCAAISTSYLVTTILIIYKPCIYFEVLLNFIGKRACPSLCLYTSRNAACKLVM